MSGRVVTIEDVALLAQTSVSTVSNVLNGRLDRMRPETRVRIERAMEQLGYTPNQVARQLKTGQVPIIGLVVPSVANPFWGTFAQLVEEAARTRGYQVLLGNSERDRGREERYAESLLAHGIRGVIFGSSPLSLDHVSGLVDRGLCAVVFDREMRRSDARSRSVIDGISVDNVSGGRIATEHLTMLGHRRVGFLSGPLRTASRLGRLAGYRAALVTAGIDPVPALVWEGAPAHGFGDVEGAEFGRIGARALLDVAERPTALFAINDMYALGAYAGARDLGLRVPEDVSVVGFDDIFLAEVAQPPMTTVRQPLRDMLQTSVGFLIDRLEGRRSGPGEQMVIVPELIVRQSTAALRPAVALAVAAASTDVA